MEKGRHIVNNKNNNNKIIQSLYYFVVVIFVVLQSGPGRTSFSYGKWVDNVKFGYALR